MGDPAAGKAFRTAARAFDDSGMALHAAVARVRGQDEREAAEATAWLFAQGVTAPERLVAMLSPGAK